MSICDIGYIIQLVIIIFFLLWGMHDHHQHLILAKRHRKGMIIINENSFWFVLVLFGFVFVSFPLHSLH